VNPAAVCADTPQVFAKNSLEEILGVRLSASNHVGFRAVPRNRYGLVYALDVTVATIAPTARRCGGCGEPLPLLSRPNRRHHDDRCRQIAARRRRREQADRRFAADQGEVQLAEAVRASTSELRLLAQLAKAAAGGSVRASIYLLERLHPVDAGQEHDRPERVDELAALRALHRARPG